MTGSKIIAKTNILMMDMISNHKNKTLNQLSKPLKLEKKTLKKKYMENQPIPRVHNLRKRICLRKKNQQSKRKRNPDAETQTSAKTSAKTSSSSSLIQSSPEDGNKPSSSSKK